MKELSLLIRYKTVPFGPGSSNKGGSPSCLWNLTVCKRVQVRVNVAHHEGTWLWFSFLTLFLHEDILTMDQIPLSFPSVVSLLPTAELFQICSSRSEMRLQSNKYNSVYVCSTTSIHLNKCVTSPQKLLHFEKRCFPLRIPLAIQQYAAELPCEERRGAALGPHSVARWEGATCWWVSAVRCGSRRGAAGGRTSPPGG